MTIQRNERSLSCGWKAVLEASVCDDPFEKHFTLPRSKVPFMSISMSTLLVIKICIFKAFVSDLVSGVFEVLFFVNFLDKFHLPTASCASFIQ